MMQLLRDGVSQLLALLRVC